MGMEQLVQCSGNSGRNKKEEYLQMYSFFPEKLPVGKNHLTSNWNRTDFSIQMEIPLLFYS